MTNHTPSDVVATRVRDLRKRRGWTAQQLAKRCAVVGAPRITALVIANIETGRRDEDGRRRRQVTVDELLAFAWAFGVPPALLLLPVGVDEGLAVTADIDLRRAAAALWLTGDEPLSSAPRPAWLADTQHLRLYRSAGQALSLATHAYVAEMPAEHRDETIRELAWSLDQLADAGIPAPFTVPSPLADDVRRYMRHPDSFTVLRVSDHVQAATEHDQEHDAVGDRG